MRMPRGSQSGITDLAWQPTGGEREMRKRAQADPYSTLPELTLDDRFTAGEQQLGNDTQPMVAVPQHGPRGNIGSLVH